MPTDLEPTNLRHRGSDAGGWLIWAAVVALGALASSLVSDGDEDRGCRCVQTTDDRGPDAE